MGASRGWRPGQCHHSHVPTLPLGPSGGPNAETGDRGPQAAAGSGGASPSTASEPGCGWAPAGATIKKPELGSEHAGRTGHGRQEAGEGAGQVRTKRHGHRALGLALYHRGPESSRTPHEFKPPCGFSQGDLYREP